MKESASKKKKADQTLIRGPVVKLSRLTFTLAVALVGVMDGTTSPIGIIQVGTAPGGASCSNQDSDWPFTNCVTVHSHNLLDLCPCKSRVQ